MCVALILIPPRFNMIVHNQLRFVPLINLVFIVATVRVTGIMIGNFHLCIHIIMQAICASRLHFRRFHIMVSPLSELEQPKLEG